MVPAVIFALVVLLLAAALVYGVAKSHRLPVSPAAIREAMKVSGETLHTWIHTPSGWMRAAVTVLVLFFAGLPLLLLHMGWSKEQPLLASLSLLVAGIVGAMLQDHMPRRIRLTDRGLWARRAWSSRALEKEGGSETRLVLWQDVAKAELDGERVVLTLAESGSPGLLRLPAWLPGGARRLTVPLPAGRLDLGLVMLELAAGKAAPESQ